MLNLENLKVIELEDHEEIYVIHAQSISPNRSCTECSLTNTVIIDKSSQPYTDSGKLRWI